MTPLAMTFHDFNPVAFAIGPFAVKWYGLAYMAGLILGWLYIRRLVQEAPRFARGWSSLGWTAWAMVASDINTCRKLLHRCRSGRSLDVVSVSCTVPAIVCATTLL